MTRVLVFAKAPRSGLVKTRLAREVGEERALSVYRNIGEQVTSAVSSEYPVTVWYDPPGAEPEMRAWLGDREFATQRGSDLGSRMEHAFRHHFARGDTPVLAIGADAPAVTAETIREALGILQRVDVAIGPAVDGGYYLLGLKVLHEPLFHEVPWGTSDVLQVTVRRCQDLDLTVGQLGIQRDVDTAEDLEALNM
jgi:rSAM/selenodomain-associated transferase 1